MRRCKPRIHVRLTGVRNDLGSPPITCVKESAQFSFISASNALACLIGEACAQNNILTIEARLDIIN